MKSYVYTGKVLPERAQLSVDFPSIAVNFLDGKTLTIKLNIILNQIAAFVTSDNEEIQTIRNFLQDFVRGHFSILSFTHGYAYETEIT